MLIKYLETSGLARLVGRWRWYRATLLLLCPAPEPTPGIALEFEAIRRNFDTKRDTDIEQVEGLSVYELGSEFERIQPHIIHIAGEGNDAGELLVSDEHGQRFSADADALSALFGDRPGLVCVVLTTCYGALQAERIRDHVGVAVGVRRQLLDDLGKIFAREFYRQLALGESIGHAFDATKKTLDLAPDAIGDLELHHHEAVDPYDVFLHEPKHRWLRWAAALGLVACVVAGVGMVSDFVLGDRLSNKPDHHSTPAPYDPSPTFSCLALATLAGPKASSTLSRACLTEPLLPDPGTIFVSDEHERAVEGASVTAIVRGDVPVHCSTDEDGTCTLVLERKLADHDEVQLRAQAGRRRSLVRTLRADELRAGGVKIIVESPPHCQLIVVESLEDPEVVHDIRSIQVELGHASLSASQLSGEDKGIWAYPCPDVLDISPVHYWLRRGSLIRERNYDQLQRHQTVPWSASPEQPND